jgi:hypothetical protein
MVKTAVIAEELGKTWRAWLSLKRTNAAVRPDRACRSRRLQTSGPAQALTVSLPIQITSGDWRNHDDSGTATTGSVG